MITEPSYPSDMSYSSDKMKTSRLPYDLTAEFRAYQSRHRRTRQLAWTGATLFCALVGLGLGALAGMDRSLSAAAIVFAITAWGGWGLHYLSTRY
jgi:hypothetical protein